MNMRQVDPDLHFGPDILSSEPISKVASGNHGGNGTPFRRWSSARHSTRPATTLGALLRVKSERGGLRWGSIPLHNTRRDFPRLRTRPKGERQQKQLPHLPLLKETPQNTSDTKVACDTPHIHRVWADPCSLHRLSNAPLLFSNWLKNE